MAPSAPQVSVGAEPATALLERDRELGEIDATLSLATVGSGRLLMLEGHPGIGKSSLMAAAQAAAQDAGLRVLSARCNPLEEEFAWGVATQLIGSALSGSSARERKRLLGEPDTPVFRLFDRRVAPERSSPPQTVFALIHGLFWLIADLAERAPLVLLVDDGQWCDGSSLRFLVYVLERLEKLPVAIVLASRPGGQARHPDLFDRIATHHASRTHRVQALGLDSVGTLVRRVFADATDEFCGACAERTAGNPFYLHELLLALRAEHQSAAQIELSDVQSIAPAAVSRSVLVRIARVDDGAGALAHAVAILGAHAELRHAAELAELNDRDAARAFDALTSAEVLAVGEPLSFVHPLVAAAIYDDIPAARRANFHLRAAQLLESEDADPQRVAAHLLASSPRGDAWAVAALQSAARLTLARASPESAARYLARALQEPPVLELRAELLRELGDAQAMTGQLDAAADSFEEALGLIADPHQRAELQFASGRALTMRGSHLAAAEEFKSALAALDDDGSELARELRVAYVAAASLEVTLRDDALAGLEALERDPERPLTRSERALLTQHALHAAMLGEPQQHIRRLAERAWENGAMLAEETADGPTWNLLTGALSFSEQLAFCESVCDAVLDDARRRGSPMAFATASYCRSSPYFYMGRISDSVADIELALEARADGWEMFLPSAYAIYALGQIERGELERAHATLALAEAPGVDTNLGFTWVLEARGRLHLAGGRPQEALDAFLAAGELLTGVFSMPSPGIMPWRSDAARSASAMGDHVRARELAEEDLKRARRVGSPGMIGRALHTMGLIDPSDHGLTLLEQATETLARSPAGLEYAHALVDLGAARRRGGQRTAAQEPLREGLALAQAGGAGALRERARVELAATGARPRKQIRTGADSLTPSERRVAEMAAQGQTNKQIARALFVTIKTVEAHLHHTYQKLAIGARKELADALAAT